MIGSISDCELWVVFVQTNTSEDGSEKLAKISSASFSVMFLRAAGLVVPGRSEPAAFSALIGVTLTESWKESFLRVPFCGVAQVFEIFGGFRDEPLDSFSDPLFRSFKTFSACFNFFGSGLLWRTPSGSGVLPRNLLLTMFLMATKKATLAAKTLDGWRCASQLRLTFWIFIPKICKTKSMKFHSESRVFHGFFTVHGCIGSGDIRWQISVSCKIAFETKSTIVVKPL